MATEPTGGADDNFELELVGSLAGGLRLSSLSSAVIGAAIEVHRVLGPGYLEAMYQIALQEELRLRGIPFRRQVPFDVEYKTVHLGAFRFDLIVDDTILVELKHVHAIAPIHTAQAIAYLKCTGLPLGLILNFNAPTLKAGIRRVYRPFPHRER